MEVIDPAMTVKVTGLFGQILYIVYKIINALITVPQPVPMGRVGHPSFSRVQRGGKMGEKNLNNYYLREFHTIILRARNRIGPHNQDVISLIIGSLLGDGYFNKRLIEGSRICFRQSNIHKDYLF
jgi:hypothetical protein